MPSQLERFIELIQPVTTFDGLSAAVTQVRDQLDVEHVVYHSVNSTGEQYAALTYPAQWVDRYIAQDYARIDPVVLGCFRRFHPVDWKRLDWTQRAARAFLGEALDAGVGNQGFSVPIRGPNGQFALFTVSDRRSDREWEKFQKEHVADFLILSHYLNQKALELERGNDFQTMNSLSPREADALTMLAMGLNRSQAAESLSISEHTFRVYVESARLKLGAANTTHAVARAIALGFVMI
ncbi:MAG: LuxR family transcriptional regulator [Rhodobacteraceae bacterium]|nr:LuxR family transcriptional regulator [Paracoccaceae bacterium]